MEWLSWSILIAVLPSTCATAVTVQTSSGLLNGYQTISTLEALVNVFKRVPYAAPPVGELRFEKPKEPLKWSGIRDATEYGPACMSNSSVTTSPQKWIDEDCLHVNIFAGAECLERSCPVAVYIHGGGFNYDSAVMFNDEYLIDNFGANGVVLVIPGFRLGFFGLLTFSNDDVVPTNLAAYDIIAALEFVQKEIHHFGGDPTDVTLMGHSEGATAAAQLAFSKTIDPYVKLFHKAIMMSMEFVFSDKDHMQEITKELAYRAKCTPARSVTLLSNPHVQEVVQCLKKLNGFELLRLQREMEDDDDSLKPVGLIMTAPLFPAKDLQEFLRSPPVRSIMTGTVAIEMDDTNDPLEEEIVSLLGIKNSNEIIKLYHKDQFENRLPFNHSTESQEIFLSTYVIGHRMRDAGGKVYLYSYENLRHSEHTDDLSYIMGVHTFERDSNEKSLAIIYPHFFMNFIKTGKPRHDWTPLQPKLDNYMYVDINIETGLLPHMANNYKSDVISYWKGMVELDKEISRSKVKVAQTRTIEETTLPPDSASVLLFFFPVIFVVCAVLIVGYIVRSRLRRTGYLELKERTPLL